MIWLLYDDKCSNSQQINIQLQIERSLKLIIAMVLFHHLWYSSLFLFSSLIMLVKKGFTFSANIFHWCFSIFYYKQDFDTPLTLVGEKKCSFDLKHNDDIIKPKNFHPSIHTHIFSNIFSICFHFNKTNQISKVLENFSQTNNKNP